MSTKTIPTKENLPSLLEAVGELLSPEAAPILIKAFETRFISIGSLTGLLLPHIREGSAFDNAVAVTSRVLQEYGVEITFDLLETKQLEPPQSPQPNNVVKFEQRSIRPKKRRRYDSQGLLSRYIDEIRATPLLSPEKKAELSKRWFQGKDMGARDELVLGHLRAVLYLATKVNRKRVRMADAILEGNALLMELTERHDPNIGCFTAFAFKSIKLRFMGLTGYGRERKTVKTRYDSIHVPIREVEFSGVLRSTGECTTVSPLEAQELLEEISARVRRLIRTVWSLETVTKHTKQAFLHYYGLLEGSTANETLRSVAAKSGTSPERVRQMILNTWRVMNKLGVKMTHKSLKGDLSLIPIMEERAGIEAMLIPTLKDTSFILRGLSEEERYSIQDTLHGKGKGYSKGMAEFRAMIKRPLKTGPS